MFPLQGKALNQNYKKVEMNSFYDDEDFHKKKSDNKFRNKTIKSTNLSHKNCLFSRSRNNSAWGAKELEIETKVRRNNRNVQWDEKSLNRKSPINIP